VCSESFIRVGVLFVEKSDGEHVTHLLHKLFSHNFSHAISLSSVHLINKINCVTDSVSVIMVDWFVIVNVTEQNGLCLGGAWFESRSGHPLS
jgi:hypothetical protein